MHNPFQSHAPLPRPTWIQAPWQGDKTTSVPAPFFRVTFGLDRVPREAWMQLTALGLVDAEINGRAVSPDVFAPGWTDYRVRLRYHSYSVTPFLRKGDNALGFVLGDGWYCGHVSNQPRQLYGARPRLLARLVWCHADGTVGGVASSPAWRCRSGPILAADLLQGEVYDARLEIPGWSEPGADTDGWDSAEAAPPQAVTLFPHADPPVRRMEILPGKERASHTPRERVFDFGVNLAGRLRIRVSGPRGLALRLRHAEMLEPSGEMYTGNLRGARAEDRYILNGGGLETWEPRFTCHGFRHASLSWEEGKGDLHIEKVEAVVLYNDLPVTGTFHCDHDGLNQLARNILRSQKGNFIEVPTDCPQRNERLGWTGDAQVFLPTAARWMDVRPFFRKWLRDMRDGQRDDGAIPATFPDTESFNLPPDAGPAWADASLICPWHLYQIYGEPDFLSENLDMMLLYMDYLAANKVKDHIRAHPDLDPWGGFGDWLALDGSERTEGKTPKDLIGTAFYANNARILAESHRVLGLTADRDWQKLCDDIAKAFRDRFVVADGCLREETQTGYVLALHFGLLSPEQIPFAAGRLRELILENDTHLGTGFVGTPHLLGVLEANGMIDLAYELLLQESFPSWLFPVRHGATSIWERWDGWHPVRGFQDRGMNSFNHYAYGAVGEWMFATVAGLRFDPPGRKHVRFAPRPGGGLRHASASRVTPEGPVSISWRLEADAFSITLEVPPGHSATLDLSGKFSHLSRPLPPGTHALTLEPQ